MWLFQIGELLARLILFFLPRRWRDRIAENSGELTVYVLSSGIVKTKPKMTFIEGVFATILFDLALFGTDNVIINAIIRLFTNVQNKWDETFASSTVAKCQIIEFCNRLSIQVKPWIWEKPIEEYVSLNDFFSRTYAPEYFPALGEASLVAPACCTMTIYENNQSLQTLLIKGCEYQLEDIGLPLPVCDVSDYTYYAQNQIFIGYLSPTDYHRVHAPISGTCIHCQMVNENAHSSSVKFFDGKFNILNDNKRLVVVLERDNDDDDNNKTKIALVVIGGIGVDSIVYDRTMVGKKIEKGQELSAFRAGGSAIAMFSTAPLALSDDLKRALKDCQHVEVEVGASLANFT